MQESGAIGNQTYLSHVSNHSVVIFFSKEMLCRVMNITKKPGIWIIDMTPFQ